MRAITATVEDKPMTGETYSGLCAECDRFTELCDICDRCIDKCCPGTCAADYPADDATRQQDYEDN